MLIRAAGTIAKLWCALLLAPSCGDPKEHEVLPPLPPGTSSPDPCAKPKPRSDALLLNDFDETTAPELSKDCISKFKELGLSCRKLGANARGGCSTPFCDERGLGSVCIEYESDSGIALRKTGKSLRLTFNVTGAAGIVDGGPIEPFAGYVESATSPACSGDHSPIDVSSYTHLTFWVRLGKEGFDVELAIKSQRGAETAPKLYLSGYLVASRVMTSCGQWRRVAIPLKELATTQGPGAVDLRHLIEVSVAVPGRFAEKRGVIYFDEFAFERFPSRP